MVNLMNTILSYNFIPDIVEILKHFLIHSGFAFIIFIIISLITAASKGLIRTFFSALSMISVIYLSIVLLISSVCILLIPTLFCIISIRIGLVSVFEIPTIVSAIISTVFCISILALITKAIHNE